MSNTPALSKNATIAAWIFQVVAAVIILQTLFFKFTGAPEPVWIFSQLGAEPVGRIGSGVLFITSLAAIGAIIAAGTMLGAIVSHAFVLGIAIEFTYLNDEGIEIAVNDGGTLFVMALVVLVASLVVAYLRRATLPIVGPKLAPQAG